MRTTSFQIKSHPSADQIPALAMASGMAPSSTPCGQTYLPDCETKVLILSARGEVSVKVSGLDAGANDYLTKPFHLDELAARIRSLTLRRFTQSDIVLPCGKLSFDTKARIASVDSEALSLTRKETGIMEYLMLNQGRPVSQEELIERVARECDE